MRARQTDALVLKGVARDSGSETIRDLFLKTNLGTIRCRLHKAAAGNTAILWVFGSCGGLGGPAGGIYERLAGQLQFFDVTSLQLDYRRPGYLSHCVEDVLLGIEYLASLGKNKVVLVGHSFGGAVVIASGVISNAVTAVAALSSQSMGTENVSSLSPKPLLLIHGSADEILPDSCSRHIYQNALQPKEIILYENCLHGLDQCRKELNRDLMRWLIEVLQIETENNA